VEYVVSFIVGSSPMVRDPSGRALTATSGSTRGSRHDSNVTYVTSQESVRRVITATYAGAMKYLLLGYTPVADWDNSDVPSEDAMAAFATYQQFEAELRESGEFVTSEGLAHPAMTTTVRKTDAGVVATDGPFAELKEVLVSYALIDVASHERAVEIASRIVEALGEPVEIRPVMSVDLA
jgi:hypothetical protein